MINIQLNTSTAFHNKTNLTGKQAVMAYSFEPVSIPLTALVHHIRTGNAFTMGHFESNHRIESSFVSSQLLGLDLDKCQWSIDDLEEQSEFIQDYAFMMYPTPSSIPENPKTRILFVLDKPIEGADSTSRWRVLQMALMEHFEAVQPDHACKDPSRLFYGCETPDYYINYDARLPLALVGSLALPQAEQDDFHMLTKHYTVTYHREDTDVQRCAVNYLNKAFSVIGSAVEGTRHNTFRNYAMWLYGLNAGGWPITISEIEAGLISIASGWGDSEGTMRNNMKWAFEHCKPTSVDEEKISKRGRYMDALKRQERYGR